jgi:hypothetical protein
MGCEPKDPEPEPETVFQRWGLPEEMTDEEALVALYQIFFGE